MKTRKIVAIVFVLCGLVLWPLPAEGTPITIEIEAVVDSVMDEGNYLEGKINPGDTITGFYIYESTTPDSNPSSPSIGRYEHYTPPHGIFLSVSGLDFETDLANVDFLVEVGNDHPWFDPSINKDHYLVRSYNNIPLSNGTLVDHISWQLDDPTGNALSSDDLPTTAPTLNDWQANHLRLEADRKYLVDAHVTSSIPEPATTLLFGLGGLLLRKRT